MAELIHQIHYFLKQCRFSSEWRKNNSNNKTIARTIFPIDSVKVGNYTYGDLYVMNWHNCNTLNVGSFCSVAGNVTFFVDGEHYTNGVSSFPFKSVLKLGDEVGVSKGNITVGDDVWIGQNAIILSGVHIGQGAVIAAGAVVSKDVPPYAIVGGVPAKVIKYRFSPDVINVLMTIDYSKLTKELIKDHIDDLYRPLDGLSAEEVEEAIAWMPKKTKHVIN